MPPAVKKTPTAAAVAAATPALPCAEADTAGETEKTAPRDAKPAKKEKKEAKDKAEGTFKITSFFTKKPAVGSPVAPATPVAQTAAASACVALVAVKDNASDKEKGREEACIMLVDSDSECAAKDGSNTPPTAVKKPECVQQDAKNLSDAMRQKEGAGGNSAPATGQGPAKGSGATALPDAKAKPEGKKKSVRPPKVDRKDIKDEVAKGRQGTLCFQPGPMRQGTLDISGKANASSIRGAPSTAPLKVKKERPQHPDGRVTGLSSQFLTTLQFCNTFSEQLEIEPVSKEDFDSALCNFPDDVLSQMHMGLLYTILMNSKSTKDEVNFLDADTWPEILRQHLEDARGPYGARARELAVASADYANLSKEQRLDILEILVDDCTCTESIKGVIDAIPTKISQLEDQKEVDEIAGKYQKVDAELIIPAKPPAEDMMAVVSVEDAEVVEDLSDGKTSRQRELDRKREEDAREKKLAEEKRLREEKRLNDEAARRKAIQDRKDRAQKRRVDLARLNAQLRPPQVHTDTHAYVLVECLAPGERTLLFSEAPKPCLTTSEAISSNKSCELQDQAVRDSTECGGAAGEGGKIQMDVESEAEQSLHEKMAKVQPPSAGHPTWRQLPVDGPEKDILMQYYRCDLLSCAHMAVLFSIVSITLKMCSYAGSCSMGF
jgi:hypothetical protein